VVVRFTGGALGPPVRDLITGNPFVCRAPPDLNFDGGFLFAQGLDFLA